MLAASFRWVFSHFFITFWVVVPVAFLSGCSSSQDEQAELEVTDEEDGQGEELADEAGDEYFESEVGEYESSGEEFEPADNTVAELPAEGDFSETSDDLATGVDDGSDIAAAVADPMAGGGEYDPTAEADIPAPAIQQGPSVLFVVGDGTPTYSGPDASSGQSGTLAAGDPVLVEVSGEWAMISGGAYVMVSSLSPTPVPRTAVANAWR